jgi:outer membrane protein assembly factor BamB
LTKINHAGKVRWQFNLPPPVSDFASADLDGDGKMELLCGAGDGKLYALKEKGGKCSVLWSAELGKQTIGSPIIADINGNGKPEIVVTSEDGFMHCLGASK